MNTTFFLNCIAGNLFQTKTTPALPTEYYIGLVTAKPNEDGSGVKEPPSSAGYRRVRLDHLGEPAGGKVTNSEAINFNKSTASWGTVTHYCIFDSPTVGGGNLLIYDELSTPRTMEANTIMTIEDECLELSVKNPV